MGPDAAWADSGIADMAASAAQGDLVGRRRVTRLLQGRALDRRSCGLLVDELARHAAAGSEPATELLLEAIDGLGLARPAVRQILIAEDDVDDALQEVLVAVARSITGFRGESRFMTWLHQVARNQAVACLRRRAAPTTPPVDDGGAGPTDAQHISSMIAAQQTVAASVATLPPRYRDAVVLRDLEGLPYAEVAERLGLPLNTTRTRIARGRALLAAKVGPL